MTREELEARHPQLLPALRSHPHIGWVLVQSAEHGAVVLGGGGASYLEEDRVEGDDPLAALHATAARHLLRTHGFAHAPDILVGSFYDPALDEGCAFEELISFHGGLGGSQTQPFLLYPAQLPAPEQPLVGAETLHRVLVGWRRLLEGEPATPARAGARRASAMIVGWPTSGQRSSFRVTETATSTEPTASPAAACGSSARRSVS